MRRWRVRATWRRSSAVATDDRPVPHGHTHPAARTCALAHSAHRRAHSCKHARMYGRTPHAEARAITHALTHMPACALRNTNRHTDTKTRRHAPARHLACRDSFHASRDSYRQMPLCVQAHTHFRSRTLPWRGDSAHSNGAQTGLAALAGTHRLAMPEDAASGPPPAAAGEDCAHSVKRLSRMATWTARRAGLQPSASAAGLWSQA